MDKNQIIEIEKHLQKISSDNFKDFRIKWIFKGIEIKEKNNYGNK